MRSESPDPQVPDAERVLASLAERMASAICDPIRFRSSMPSEADLRARFGGDVMARAIEEAYFAALEPAA